MWSPKTVPRTGRIWKAKGCCGKPTKDFTLDDFCDKTTLPGLSQVFSRTHALWRIFWVTVALAGVTMSLYQSWDVLMDFTGSGRTVQVISFTTAHSVDFPTVVVCSNIRVHHSKVDVLVPSVCRYDEPPMCHRELETEGTDGKMRDKLMRRLFKLVAQYNFTERRKHFYDVTDRFLVDCDRESKTCRFDDAEEIFYFNTVYHGRCFVYNRGYNRVITGTDSQDLVLKLNMDRSSRGLEVNELYASMWVSAPGVSPSFFSDAGTRIYAGDRVKVRFATRGINRLNGTPTTPYCIDAKQAHWRKLNLLYSDELQYIYDQSSCSFYFQDRERRAKNCYHPGVDYENWAQALELPNLTICSLQDCPDYCTTDIEYLLAEIRKKCATPCREQILQHNVNTMSLWLESLVERSLVNASMTESEGVSMDSIVFNESQAIIEIAPWSTVIEEISEAYKYSLADFFGILGGNVGLWIGVSVVSLTELFELAFILLSTKKVPDKTSVVAVHKIKRHLNPDYVKNVGKRRPMRL